MEFNNYEENPQKYPFLPKGLYDAYCVAYQYGTSKAGNEQVVLTLMVCHRDDDGETKMTDWLPNTKGMQWKVKAFTEAVGQEYAPGASLDMDKALNRLFRVVLTEKPRQDDPTQMQNNVEGYLSAGTKGAKQPQPVGTDDFENVF